MDAILKIEKLTYKLVDTTIFNDFALTLEVDKWYTLLNDDSNVSNMFTKIVAGLVKASGLIEFDSLDLNIKNIGEIRSKMSILADDLELQMIEDNVYNEVTTELKNIGLTEEIERYLDDIDEITHIKSILSKTIQELTEEEKYLVIITSALIKKPKLVILNETLSHLSEKERLKIYNLLHEYRQKYYLTVLNITSNLEDSLIGDNIMVIEDGQVRVNDSVKKVFDDHLLAEEKYKFPFMIELSENLKLYKLIDKNYYTMKELVDALWK